MLPSLSDKMPGLGQGWLSWLLKYSHKKGTCIDGPVSSFHVHAPWQHGAFPQEMKSSLVTSVYKKGDRSHSADYWPIAVAQGPSWTEDSGPGRTLSTLSLQVH